MNITLFGGAFDPPHNAHVRIAEELLKQKIADEVWFLPVGYHAFQKEMQSEEDREAMLTKIIKPRMKLEKYELLQGSTSYTYRTLKSLSERYPEHTFSFVIGSDNLAKFMQWDEYEKLIEEFTFYVYPRKGYSRSPLQKNMKVLEGVQQVDVSSTEVRDKVKAGESISNLVPDAIEKYIQEHHLYVSQPSES
ncbi:MAG: nicotinate-nucleotide adenylyltransferase [Patescibacteria group bacterium]|jgi:nicotinate-nucleotide adenylyltransferase|nr:nicotinate-nucleotide adenylyltransferase [Patescibacteria group bacterium]